jgi:hypothetical protein
MNLLRAAVRLAGDERVNDPSSKLGGAVIYVEGKRHVIPTIEELQAKMPGLGDDEAKNRQRSEYDRLSSQADTDTPMLDRPDPERDKVKTPLNHRMRWDAYVDDGTIEEAARRLQSPPLQSLLARLQPKDFKIPAREQFLDLLRRYGRYEMVTPRGLDWHNCPTAEGNIGPKAHLPPKPREKIAPPLVVELPNGRRVLLDGLKRVVAAVHGNSLIRYLVLPLYDPNAARGSRWMTTGATTPHNLDRPKMNLPTGGQV